MDAIRIGLPTSSNIHRLMGAKKPFDTYVKEKKRELRLGIEINTENYARPLCWGKGCEGYVHNTYIEVEYQLDSNNTDVHESGAWCGTKDLIRDNCVADIKCPMTRTSFCDLVDIIESGRIEFFKKENPEYYYQLVSNSVLTKCDYAELIVFMPYEKEIPDLIEHFELLEDFEVQKGVQWVIHSELKSIPHLPNNSKYKNLYRFKFLVPIEDKEEVEEKAIKASKLINE